MIISAIVGLLRTVRHTATNAVHRTVQSAVSVSTSDSLSEGLKTGRHKYLHRKRSILGRTARFVSDIPSNIIILCDTLFGSLVTLVLIILLVIVIVIFSAFSTVTSTLGFASTDVTTGVITGGKPVSVGNGESNASSPSSWGATGTLVGKIMDAIKDKYMGQGLRGSTATVNVDGKDYTLSIIDDEWCANFVYNIRNAATNYEFANYVPYDNFSTWSYWDTSFESAVRSQKIPADGGKVDITSIGGDAISRFKNSKGLVRVHNINLQVVIYSDSKGEKVYMEKEKSRYIPKKGDQWFNQHHTGLVYSMDEKDGVWQLTTLEGNTGGGSGIVGSKTSEFTTDVAYSGDSSAKYCILEVDYNQLDSKLGR